MSALLSVLWQMLVILVQNIIDRIRGLSEFERRINLLSLQITLTLTTVNENVALFMLNLDSGQGVPVLITNHDPVVKMMMVTTVGFHEADFPSELAYGLLTRNGNLPAGSWQVLPIEGREVCCIAFPMALSNLGDSGQFVSVLKTLASEYDEFAAAMKRYRF